MKVFSKREAGLWCEANDIALGDHDLPDQSDADFKFEIPADAQKRVYIVTQALQAFAGDPLVLVWFDDWAVWPSGQRMHVFDRFRMSYGETRPLIESPGHLFEQTEFEDAISFVTIAVLFLWDCYVVTPGRRKLLYLSHHEYGLIKGGDLPGSTKFHSPGAGIKRHRVLPVWQTDLRSSSPGDPIGCPVTIEEMIQYIRPIFSNALPKDFEFLQRGDLDKNSYWLWVFYGDDGERWNLCVFSGQDPPGGPIARTWMCADNNPYNFDDREYIMAIFNKKY